MPFKAMVREAQKNMIRDPRWIGSKMSKMPYLTIFNKLKHFTMPTFGYYKKP